MLYRKPSVRDGHHPPMMPIREIHPGVTENSRSVIEIVFPFQDLLFA